MPLKIAEMKNKSNQPFSIKAKSGSNTADVVIYQPIGKDFWGEYLSAQAVSDQLKALDPSVKNLNIRLNSPGGDVFDGVAIHNLFKAFKAKTKGTITVQVDGIAASIASIIMLAGDEIIMGDGAMIMIHLPWTMAMGNRNDIDNTVNLLIEIEEQMVTMYAKKTGISRIDIKQMLEDETWMGADVAIEKGFADSQSGESLPIAAGVFDKSSWIRRAPKAYKSETAVVQEQLKNLKSKISARIARK